MDMESAATEVQLYLCICGLDTVGRRINYFQHYILHMETGSISVQCYIQITLAGEPSDLVLTGR